MPYRRTDNVRRKLAARHEAILTAARALASEGGIAAVQIAPVAERAGIAAGTVYRYFPSKTELVAELVAGAGAGRDRRARRKPPTRRRDRCRRSPRRSRPSARGRSPTGGSPSR